MNRARRRVAKELVDIVLDYGVESLQRLKEALESRRSGADDPYALLGVRESDPLEMIEAVYRAKVRYLHPDNKETGDRARFEQVNQAWERVKVQRRERPGPGKEPA